MPDDLVKQVICVRHDLHMRMGKAIAQGAHASMWFLVRKLLSHFEGATFDLSDTELHWLLTGTRKICARVDSLEQLNELLEKAQAADLCVHVVTDAGHTEFHGEPTPTALAIGPDLASKIDPITGHLKLL